VALARAGHEVVAVAAVSDASVRRAREHFPAASVADPANVVAAADLVLLTVPDDALPGLISGLAATGAALGGRLLAHTSGGMAHRCSSLRRGSGRSRWRCTQ